MKRLTHWALILILLASGTLAYAWPPGGNGGGKPPKDEDPPAEPVVEYDLVPLGLLGGSSGQARDLNDLGEVVGWSNTPDGIRHAFVYTNRFSTDGSFALEDMNDLIDEPDGVLTGGYGINQSGQIVGDAIFGGARVGFIYTPPSVVNEGMPDEETIPYSLVIVEDPASVETYADDINDLGDISGVFVDEDENSRFFVRLANGDLIESGVQRTLGPPSAINLAGSVVSWVPSSDPLVTNEAFRFDIDGTVTYLPLLGGPDAECGNTAEANDINVWGEIVGQSTQGQIPTGKKGKNAYTCGSQHAFRYSPQTGMQDLQTLDGLQSFAEGINDFGEVVGTITVGFQESHVFLYTDDDLDGDGVSEQMIDLNAGLNLPPELEGETLNVHRINNDRWICGQTGAGNAGMPFLLIPSTP